MVRGARQVGKTSFILDILQDLSEYPQILLNLAFQHKQSINGKIFYGRDYFGHDDEASELLKNLTLTFGELHRIERPIIVFIDEADRHPISLEAIQKLAEISSKLKFIYTGSNLENVKVKNAATGRKKNFDLYPVTFSEFLNAYGKSKELRYWQELSLKNPLLSAHLHQELSGLFQIYKRLGGMPRVVDAFLDRAFDVKELPLLISDLVTSIEENVKTVLGEKTSLYEYEDILRKMAFLSMETLKLSRLQVQHASRNEAKKLVNKTVGARVAHKIRLYESATDLSKYILFDSGVLNYLLNGSDLLNQKITEAHDAIMYENVVGNELISTLPARDDLFYWKSKKGAQVEYIIRHPLFMAIDVKSTSGNTKSLQSCAIFEKELDMIIKISRESPTFIQDYKARIPNPSLSRSIPLMILPHYLSGRLLELIS